MDLLTSHYYCWRISGTYISNFISGNTAFICGNTCGHNEVAKTSSGRASNACSAYVNAFAGGKSVKKPKRDKDKSKNNVSLKRDQTLNGPSELKDNFPSKADSERGYISSSNEDVKGIAGTPSRSSVLRACTITCGLIAALAIVIRQVSHAASLEGLPVPDCSKLVSFDLEAWHLGLISGLVISISLSRYALLKAWPDFAESSEAANRQVLSSLGTQDYIVVAFLPGISEELLFRGALLPLLGFNWKSALVVASVFGVLHLGSGRKHSFAIWATCVGFAYGYATIASSSMVVPMASHALNNLVGAFLWRYASRSSEQTK